ncbi:MAG: hypothetical protein JWO30_1533 [Fibrobacteres bacterium]|nr:hypothetical protein [Fibrobacterota bacterium]
MKDDTLKEERAQIVDKIRQFFQDERDEELGELPAAMLLDFIEKEIAPFFYNRGVREAKAKTIEAFASLTEEMDYLEMLVPKRPGPRPSRD